MIFKGSCPSLKFQHRILDISALEHAYALKIISELSLTPANLNILGYQMVGGNCVEIDVCKHSKCSHECINIGPCQNVT